MASGVVFSALHESSDLGAIESSPRKTNECPLENEWLEGVFPIEIVPFKGDMLGSPGV